eukprot:comp21818_c0_seq3/m.49121 comp21818_c0_seq3/g.49121  ORF comp21818_c0_seq3/g.49121 comp21818_c0_seq3/m.49121 type:complete len:629 (+) comp21818_c0_seq3:1-1887(+)
MSVAAITEKLGNIKLGEFAINKDLDLLVEALHSSFDEMRVIEILTGRTESQIQQLRGEFEKKTGKSIESILLTKTSGNLQSVLIGLVKTKAEFDAIQLFEAMDGVGTTESVLIDVLTTRSNAQITAIKSKFFELYKKPLDTTIASETRGHFEKTLLSLLEANREEATAVDQNRAKLDAETLYRAGEKKIGTDEGKFIEILTKRSIMHNIAVSAEYAKVSSKTLRAAIESETSGSFRDVLVALSDAVEHVAEGVNKAVAGVGTSDKKLIRLCVGHDQGLLQKAKEAYVKKFKTNMMKDVENDISGNYRKALLRVLCCGRTVEFESLELREAMKGVGTNTNLLIDTLTNHHMTKDTLAQLAASFERNFGHLLVNDLKSETSGNLTRFLVGLITPQPLQLAEQLHHAIKGVGTKESVVIEILGSRGNKTLAAVAAEYRKLAGTDLTGAIQGDFTGDTEKLLTSLLRANRNEHAPGQPFGPQFTEQVAASEALALYQAGEGRLGTNDSLLVQKVQHYSPEQLAVISEIYSRSYGRSLYDAIKKETSGTFETALLGAVDPDRFAAECLRKAMKGLGTNDTRLIDMISARDRPEIQRISNAYKALFARSLKEDVKSELSGTYERAVLAWMNLAE